MEKYNRPDPPQHTPFQLFAFVLPESRPEEPSADPGAPKKVVEIKFVPLNLTTPVPYMYTVTTAWAFEDNWGLKQASLRPPMSATGNG